MTTTLFTFVRMFEKAVGNAEHLLAKGVQHAESLGEDAQAILNWRLIDDMQPLRFQLMVVCNFASQWPARVAALPVPDAVVDHLDVDGFQAALADARAYLSGLEPAQFEGRDAVPLTYMIGTGMEPTMESGRWLSGFVTTNLYFHMSMIYAILRSRGVPLGKIDLFATGI